MKHLCFVPIIFVLSCSLIQPSQLLITNKSEYDINVVIDNYDYGKIEKGKGDFYLLVPGNHNVKFTVDEINIIIDKNFEIFYLETREYEFNLY